MKLNALTAALGLALIIGSGSAAAFYLPPGDLTSGTPGANLEDDDNDWFINLVGSANEIDVGDRLIAVVDINQIVDILPANGITPPQPIGPNNDVLTAISDITALAKTEIFGNGNGICQAGEVCRWDFGPTPGGLLDVPAYQKAGIIPMVAFFTAGGVPVNLNTCGSQAACTAAVLDGTLWASFGKADPDDEWYTIAPVNGTLISVVQATGATTKVNTINYALDLFVNNSGLDIREQKISCVVVFACAGDGWTELEGSADILGGEGLLNGAFARSDADASLLIPEPATLGLLGVGLLGMGAALRRRSA